MQEKMLKFINIARDMPIKRLPNIRRKDYDEIYQEYAAEKAKEQSSRCSQCGVPFCQSHCPLHNNIPDWLRLTALGRVQEAYELSQATNTFPEICGRICPQDRLCEGNCVIEQSGHGTVTIGAIEKYISETAWKNGWVQSSKVHPIRGQSVGIIGAGPAGLAAADALSRNGIMVTVYDSYDRAGGLLIYGIPNFKLEKHVVTRRVQLLQDSGIKFVLNCCVGIDISFADIRNKHDAVLIATGVYKPRDLSIPGIDNDGIVQALDYLIASNRMGLGDKLSTCDNRIFNVQGKNVVVIGGGDTAMDCVRTAVRQGAKSVKCLYRRDRKNMPGSRRETHNAEEEGVEFIWLSTPKAFLGTTVINGILVNKMRLDTPDVSGRQSVCKIEGLDYRLDADLVIKALGFTPKNLARLWRTPGLELTRWGTLKTNFRTNTTSLAGVYAAGDIVRGGSLVVWAIRDGRTAAANIMVYLDKFLEKQLA